MENRILIVEPKNGAGEYEYINDAIKDATDGDTILVKPGFYEEVVIIDKAVELIIDPETERGDTVITSGVIATCATGSLSNFVVHQLIDIRSGGISIANCEITLGSDGIRVCKGANPTIVSCTIHSINGGGAGVYFQEGSSGLVQSCDISKVRCDGIHVKGASDARIIGNTIHDCPNGIYFRESGKGTVDGNTIENCTAMGIYIQTGSDPIITNNKIEGCGIHAILVSQGGAGQIKDNTVGADSSVRTYKGCTANIGLNTFAGRYDTDVEKVLVAATI